MEKFKYGAVLLMGLVMFALASCKKPDYNVQPIPGQIGTISNYLNNNFDLSLFAAAVQKAGLADSLNVPSTAYTVWAPVNSALNNEGILTAADFDKWGTDSIRYFVRSHLVPGKLFYQNIPASTSDNRYKNLNGADLYVSKYAFANFPLIVDGVSVQPVGQLGSGTTLSFGVTQLNGVIYPISGAIKNFKGTVQDFINSRPELSVLSAGLKKFGFSDQMKGNGPFTVFAPVDTAFARYGLTQSTVATMNTVQYDPVLFGAYFVTPYHIYVLDVVQLTGASVNTPFNTTVADYKVIPRATQSYNSVQVGAILAKGTVTASNTAKTLGPIDPGQSVPWGSIYLGEEKTVKTQQLIAFDYKSPPFNRYINFTCTNGVVHLLTKVLVMPSEVKIN